MEALAFLLVVPILWPFIAKAIWKHQITTAEIAVNVAIGILVVCAGWFGGRYGQMVDVELLNGEVLRKESHKVSCSHSYRCNCVQSCSTDSQGNRSCTESCSTCYDHSYDVDHTLFTNLNNIDIERIDRQGLKVPPRFERAQIGDPVAQQHRFVNYIKAAPDSLFNTLAEKAAFEQFKGDIPLYPDAIFDYHYAARVLVVKTQVPNVGEWNDKLAHTLKKLGPSRQANVIVVLSGHADPNYAQALRSAWLGGKKNDIVLVLGTPSYPQIAWARVFSWTDNELFKVELADAVQALGAASPDAVLELVQRQTLKNFERKPMKDFEYLKDDIEPPLWLLVLLFIVSLVASITTSVVLSANSYTSLGRMRLRR